MNTFDYVAWYTNRPVAAPAEPPHGRFNNEYSGFIREQTPNRVAAEIPGRCDVCN